MENKDKAIKELFKLDIKSKDDLMVAKRRLARKYGIGILRNSDILVETHCNASLRKVLRKRAVRTLSGIAPVAILVKPFPCPGKCVYCPTERGVPQSYLSNEPAVMRAIRCDYDPYKQVQMRLRALEANGHQPEKIELIVIGGTWSALPMNYKFWYIKECFRAANEFSKMNYESRIMNYGNKKIKKIHNLLFIIHDSIKTLKKKLLLEHEKNEKSKYKIIGLTLETRPDYINEKELIEMRELGCTRVELGVQAIDDKILKGNLRGHGIKEVAQATKLLKNFGFKITYHIMPGLPGSTPARDLKMFKALFHDERFQPDQIKFYPTVVTRGSLLYKWWRAGKYKPYPKEVLEKLIIDCKKVVPEYVRIVRLVRDIPKESIVAGNTITNLRQILEQKGVKCRCIRCRECRDEALPRLYGSDLKIKISKYKASGAEEYFLQFTDKSGDILYGFCRLRLPIQNCHYEEPAAEAGDEAISENRKYVNAKEDFLKSRPFSSPRLLRSAEAASLAMTLEGAALIRELHIYGELVPVGNKKIIQHAGLGKKLMAEAEKIARLEGFRKIAVIAGVGAREYYRKLGYGLKDSYMIKSLYNNNP